MGSVELLHRDFVNIFSHEFKTPIVSIEVFAKMLKKEELAKQDREEYLDIIISEANRLSVMTTNVLNLSKIEGQSILTNKSEFNVSEQIRLIIAQMDQKLSYQQINFDFDYGEIFIVVYGLIYLIMQLNSLKINKL